MTALLVTGARGQLGTDLLAVAAAAGVTAHGVGSAELDVSDAQRVRDTVAAFAASHRDAVVVNAGAYTAVDAAETDADRAFQVNAVGPGLLAASCAEHGLPLLHLSTDYVFPGTASRPYEVDDPTGPRSVYGRTKLAGERAVLSGTVRGYVVRTAWLYGSTGHNFVRTMARLERSRDTVSVVDDQVGSPTWSADLAQGLLALALANGRVEPGILHYTSTGSATWYEFAKAVFVELGADPARVGPCSSAQYPSPVARPPYSVLSTRAWVAAGLPAPRPWRDALAAAFATARDAFTSTPVPQDTASR